MAMRRFQSLISTGMFVMHRSACQTLSCTTLHRCAVGAGLTDAGSRAELSSCSYTDIQRFQHQPRRQSSQGAVPMIQVTQVQILSAADIETLDIRDTHQDFCQRKAARFHKARGVLNAGPKSTGPIGILADTRGSLHEALMETEQRIICPSVARRELNI